MRPFYRALTFSVATLIYGVAPLANADEPVVHTETVRLETYTIPITTSGVLANQSEQTLSFKTPGIVADISVKEGQRVRAGELIAVLDREEIAAEVAQAEAYRDDAQRSLERFKKLYASKVAPLEQVQSAETALRVESARLKVARFNFKHSEIIAPSDGVVLRRLIEPNELVSAQRPAFVFAQENAGWVIRVGVSDKEIVRVREGDKAEVRLDAYPGQALNGDVYETAAKASPGSGVFEVEVRLHPNDARLLSGMVARVTLTPKAEEQLVMIPLSAIISAGGKNAEVFVLDANNRAHRRRIVLRDFSSSHVAVAHGLEAGETLVTRGATGLVEGMLATPVALAANP
ncbi:Membrane-fusion protein [Hahella chejuensis KCTC 2396]|uniref:Membrane-fusion protein n=1 Tax=Hahella chejuensis (strain KCTC 2396) TaxID=349521 RepID=Q2S7Z9_HAHCH|nr:efflux RND transporter periplasmic adaptor subunit [Hahella chejuensis]ABC33225.1 Membrane-fusion protein [Hahella chejuensis KCTC 2396]